MKKLLIAFLFLTTVCGAQVSSVGALTTSAISLGSGSVELATDTFYVTVGAANLGACTSTTPYTCSGGTAAGPAASYFNSGTGVFSLPKGRYLLMTRVYAQVANSAINEWVTTSGDIYVFGSSAPGVGTLTSPGGGVSATRLLIVNGGTFQIKVSITHGGGTVGLGQDTTVVRIP